MARLEYLGCLPGFPVFVAFQDLMALGDNHNVISPQFRKDFSYCDQFLTLYFGFLLRLCDSFII